MDLANQGNPYVAYLGPAKHFVERLAASARALLDKAGATALTPVARCSEALAEVRAQRAAIEREVFKGRYRLSSKSDDDLPAVS